jgi:hypothetical protein
MSPFVREIHSLVASPLMSSIGPLSKLCARTLSLLLDLFPERGMMVLSETLQALHSLTLKVESNWVASPFFLLSDGKDISAYVSKSRVFVF